MEKLNFDLRAFVSDFGTVRLLDPDSSNQTLVAGTYGYIAPGELYILFIVPYLIACPTYYFKMIVKSRVST